MEVQKGKGGIYPLTILFVMVMILFNAYCCAGAAVVVESNINAVRYNNGRLEESLIEYDLELEFFMNPYVSRMLGGKNHPIYKTGNPKRSACNQPCTGGLACGGSTYHRCDLKNPTSP